MDLTFLKPLVANILADELTEQRHRQWTAQGFGFLRTYFGPADAPKRFRLNLWDKRFMVPNVSTIHDHPWDFKSVIVAGRFYNQRYRIYPLPLPPTHTFTTIKTGEGGGLEKTPLQSCHLERYNIEPYSPGETYSQVANEIHETIFADGTVTLNERVGDTEHARVFWPHGTDWVDAIPRPATREEVCRAVLASLQGWF